MFKLDPDWASQFDQIYLFSSFMFLYVLLNSLPERFPKLSKTKVTQVIRLLDLKQIWER